MWSSKAQLTLSLVFLLAVVFPLGAQEKGVPALDERLNEILEEPESTPPPASTTASPRHLPQLNPEISVLGDFWAVATNEEGLHEHLDDDLAENEESDHEHEIKDGFRLNEVEIGIQAPLDPFSQARFFIGFHGDELHVEEGFVEWMNVPGPFQLKLGKFLTNFGILNRWHAHAWPTADIPPALENLFGDHAFSGTGASLSWLMPPFLADYNELTMEIVNGDNEHAFSGEGFKHPAGVFRFKNYWDLDKATYFEIGLSGAVGENDPDLDLVTYLEGIDLSLVWVPPGREKYRGVEARSELFFSQRDTEEGHRDAFNAVSFVEARLNRKWTAGGRLDYIQPTDVDGPGSYGGAAFLNYWQSEFVRIRFQYAALDMEKEKWRHRGIVQVVFALGPHKHEKY